MQGVKHSACHFAGSGFGLRSGDADLLRRGGIEIPEPIALARDAVLTHGKPLLPQSLADAMRWITADGEQYFLVRASPLQSDESGGAGVIVVAQDVTRFRRIDALKSDVVATVSHELKTPLTSLRLELKHVSIEVEQRAQGSLVELDAEQITIVLSNLVSNAIRHSREGGHVWLSANEGEQGHELVVKDDGDGIAPEQLPRIFERHWSGSEPSTLKGRHGLGLAIAKEIVTRHDGTLEVETKLGAGSTFRLRIPNSSESGTGSASDT